VLNAAIVGLGWWGQTLLRAVQGKSEKIRFTRGVTKELDAARELGQANNLVLSDDLSAVLDDPKIEAVVLATPHSLHVEQVIAAARAGKHVFCEKPLSLTRDGAEQAVTACKRANRVLGVGQNKHFWPGMSALRKIVSSGELGTLLHIEGHYSNEHSTKFFASWRDAPDETPGAGMTGTGIHLADAFVALGGPVSEAYTLFRSKRAGHDPRDTVTAVLSFANGLSGTLACVRASPIYWRVHVFGDNASAESLGENELVVRRRGGLVERTVFPAIDSVKAELEAFATAASGGAPYPISPQAMIDTIAAFEAINTSMRTGERVRLS
jgi:predicted dehydrogenase